jgi:hypothetical protein
MEASISNSLANLVSQILLFTNSQNNMGKKKRSHLQQFSKFCSQKPKSSAKKRRGPLSERRAPLSNEEREKDRCQADAWLPDARIYAPIVRSFANSPKMSNPYAKLLERGFEFFSEKTRMPKLFAKLLEMLNNAWPLGVDCYVCLWRG